MTLLPASFRGALFAVVQDEAVGGRRVAMHQYPGRDAVWAEDMGRAPRSFRFRGFICDGDVLLGGGSVTLQRALLVAAVERPGPGLLTHPTLGPMTVMVVRASIGQDLGAGRMSSVEFEFVEAGKRENPVTGKAGGGLFAAKGVAIAALAVDAVRAIAAASAYGNKRKALATTAATWTAKAQALGDDATALHRLAAQLPGNHGRFAGGGNDGLAGRAASPYGAAAAIADLIAASSAARVAIGAAARALGQAVGDADLGYPKDLPAAATALVDALASACADPLDAVRLLEQLLGFVPERAEATTAVGTAFGRMMRRAGAAALLSAVAAFQPRSADDAAAMITRLAQLLDTVATEAADAGDDESFRAIRGARAAAVQDLRTRGATLARVRQFAPGAPRPALVLAQRFYRDVGRADQLVGQARPIHPLFMPARFEALAA